MKTHDLEILFRCDGSSTIGIGHVMRCLALADEFRSVHHMESGFALRKDRSGAALIDKSNYPVLFPPDSTSFDYEEWLRNMVRRTDSQALILDVRDDLPTSALRELSKSGTALITIDDPSDRRMFADLAFYPPVPQVSRMDWTDFAGRLFTGWDWIPLRRDLAGSFVDPLVSDKPKILVTTGGADSAGMAPKIANFLDKVDRPLRAVFVAGPAFQHGSELEKAVADAKHDLSIEKNPQRLPDLMAGADLAVASFGVTAYELAALGVPALYLCLTTDHQESASAFVDEGIGISLGLFSEVDGEKFRRELRRLLDSFELRHTMSHRGREIVDARGTSRISQVIVEYLKKRSET